MSLEGELIALFVSLVSICAIERMFLRIFNKYFKANGYYDRRLENLLRGAVLYGIAAVTLAILFFHIITAVLGKLLQ
ncbi:MAG: hypothetical protein CEO22_520 [Candidatus Berkelbacteria bacterium Gr01-1014_85]|uniref:Uncharacterized protein n=1 Tax=Candidatus Berkelbacteria bacterium Gr01-1014_85 TaxID=2017150 RepID=A0A554JAD4_9BACT|nr:MAG: hypothetical protein CEO22_520 [Candidatus Berkelbacteria bacterium Gr01-1014_85]